MELISTVSANGMPPWVVVVVGFGLLTNTTEAGIPQAGAAQVVVKVVWAEVTAVPGHILKLAGAVTCGKQYTVSGPLIISVQLKLVVTVKDTV
jgi:hypothetical protein